MPEEEPHMTAASDAKESGQIEGQEKSQPALWGGYLIDTLLIRTETRTAHGVLHRIEKCMHVGPKITRR